MKQKTFMQMFREWERMGGLVVSARGEAVGVVSHSDAAFTQAVPIGTALAVATELIERSR